LRILVLAQTYGARVVIPVTIPRVVPVELEPGVGINDALVEPQRNAGLLVVVVDLVEFLERDREGEACIENLDFRRRQVREEER
ncbi:hypothetical protein VIGAN_08360100, partial [Vigna angularis var. angularis]